MVEKHREGGSREGGDFMVFSFKVVLSFCSPSLQLSNLDCTYKSRNVFLEVMQSAPYLRGFLLQELHLSVLEEGEEARDDVLQEGGVLQRGCHVLHGERTASAT